MARFILHFTKDEGNQDGESRKREGTYSILLEGNSELRIYAIWDEDISGGGEPRGHLVSGMESFHCEEITGIMR